MVRVAIAGGTGQVAREIIDALIESQKHHITVLSRKESSEDSAIPGVSWKVVDYDDKECLVEALRGVHTLLSFVQTVTDRDQKSQKLLIDAAIDAGVRRFAPSEFGSKGTVGMPWYVGKEAIRQYLSEVNSKENLLEYTLFQPGLFLDYLAYPYKTTKYVEPLQLIFDFQNMRAMAVEGHEDAIMTLTKASDLAAIVARAVGYEGRWPTTSGIVGNRVTFSQIFEIGEKIRGRPFTVDRTKVEDLEAGELKTSWRLEVAHSSVSDQASTMAKAVPIGMLLSSMKGAWDSSDEMNQLFPDYEFTKMEDFLTKIWEGKP